MIVVALHGPQQAGKNEVVRLILEHWATRFGFMVAPKLPILVPGSFSQKMKDIVHDIVGRVYTEEEKDQPQPELGGKTPRDAYIHIGKMDEIFGGGLWARYSWEIDKVLEKAKADPPKKIGHRRKDDPWDYTNFHTKKKIAGIIYESVGRQGQWDYFIDLRERGILDTRLIEVVRPGYVYKDNRQPIHDPLFNRTTKIVNDGDKEALSQQVKEVLVPWLQEQKIQNRNRRTTKSSPSVRPVH